MAHLPQAKSPEGVKEAGVAQIRKDYISIADYYTKIVNQDYMYCPKCGKFQSSKAYYSDDRFANKCFPICKECLLQMVERKKDKKDVSHESKETVKPVLQLLDLPYIDSLYQSCCTAVANDVSEKTKHPPFP
ncbi:hypothetical protein [Oribacterium sp. P6A1]|uniref:hypothetical protein n=1 Tax=Oribacterium sp. P6A1 TaxID=1410612 RepID=UPI000560D055|nr:hypothetical protein [Oribacterium sp. P6A1]